MTSSVFPDVNVWLALSQGNHVHFHPSRIWLDGVAMDCRVVFCRFTQMALLRLLTNPVVMGADKVLDQPQAWAIYDTWLQDPRVGFMQEPERLEPVYRHLTQHRGRSAQHWADAFLAAFAEAGGLTLVTFDRQLARDCPGALLLS